MQRQGGSNFAGYLSLILYLGAANNAATPEQREQLRQQLRPNLNQLKTAQDRKLVKNAVIGLLNTVHEVMGLSWVPDEESRRYIGKLLEQ